jgi:hypothetical protein
MFDYSGEVVDKNIKQKRTKGTLVVLQTIQRREMTIFLRCERRKIYLISSFETT